MRCAPGSEPTALTGLNLTTGDIINAIQSQNVQAAVGRIGARPISNDQQLQLNIQTKGRLTSVGGIREDRDPHQPGRLGAAARRCRASGTRRRQSRSRDPVQRRSRGGDRDLPDARRERDHDPQGGEGQARANCRTRFPDDLAWKVTYDPTVFVTDTIHEVQKTLIEAFVLVVLVVYLFLGSLRATLIPTLAVPVSLIGTFIVLNAIGYSANTVSLLAIVLAIGIVVDDAIVVVENVERVMEEHPELSPAEATKRAMAEITAPIIAITLVLLSVFVPVAFIPGISGELFRQFAVTVAVSMFLSAINALTLSPALCGVLLRPHHGPRRGLIGIVMRSIDRVRDAYGDAVARIVRFSVIGIVMVAIAAAGTVALLRVTPTGFLPEDDQGAFFVVIQLPGGASVGANARCGRASRAGAEKGGGDRRLHVGRRAEFHRQLLAAERRLYRRHAETVRGAQGRGSWRQCAFSRAWDRNSGRSAAARCCRWRRRRSSASAPAAASPMCSRICAAAIRRRSRRSCAGSR